MTTERPRRSAEEQQQLEASFRELFERLIAFNQLVGMRVDSFDPSSPRLAFEMRPELVGHFLSGRLHGGVIASVLDAVGGFALMCAIGEKHRDEPALQVMQRFAKIGTIDLRIDFLRPGNGRRFVASGQVSRLGGRIGSVQMKLENEDGMLLATGSAAYILS